MARQNGRLSRREFLKRSGAGAAAVGLGGAAAPFAFAGPHKYTGRYLKNNLSIMQWVHFVPAYDTWLDQTYAVQWGQANDTQVTIDHVALTELPARAAAEVAAGSGHDLFQFLSPPSAYQNSTIPLDDAVSEVTKKLGKMTNVGYKSTYNPRTKHYFGFADNYVPDPVVWRHDLWNAIGESPATWDHVLKAAPKLKAKGTPIGIGMSNELDSNMGKFSQNQTLAKKYLIDQQLAYQDHFMNSQFYNFPAWTNAVKGGFKTIHKLTAADTHKPLGKYTILATIAEMYTTNAGHPGFANAAVGEIFDTFLIPQMAAQVAQGKMSAKDAAKAADGQFKDIF